jgi:hypothetical protein
MIDASLMQVGDVCEFVSDRQTEKGPSSGTVTRVDDGFITIAHSDHSGEIFRASELIVNYARNKKEWAFWELA